MRLILASSSAIRQQLLTQLGLPFTSVSPEIDEKRQTQDTDISAYVHRLAEEKARKVAGSCTEPALIIAADQACTRGDDIIGKPGNFDKALAQLKSCRGRWLHFHTALTLFNTRENTSSHFIDTFSVRFAELPDEDLVAYLEKDKPWNCAGSFMLESRGVALFSEMKGTDYTSLLGLPMLGLCRLLRESGYNPLKP